MERGSSKTVFFIQTMATILFLFALVVNAVIIMQGVLEPIHMVMGDSMAPGIKSQDGLILSSSGPGDLRVGEVVVFTDPEVRSQYVVHRIVDIEEKDDDIYLRTKGDNNDEVDPVLIRPGRVLGKVAMRIPGFGFFYDFACSPCGFLMTVLAPILLLPLSFFFLGIQERRRHRSR